MSALQNDSDILSPDGRLIDDVLLCYSSFHKLHYSHTKREGNKVAHYIMRYALNISDFVVWMEDVPPPVSVVVKADAANLF